MFPGFGWKFVFLEKVIKFHLEMFADFAFNISVVGN